MITSRTVFTELPRNGMATGKVKTIYRLQLRLLPEDSEDESLFGKPVPIEILERVIISRVLLIVG